MKLLNVLKKYNKAILRENAKLKSIYETILQEEGLCPTSDDDTAITTEKTKTDDTTDQTVDGSNKLMSYSEFCGAIGDGPGISEVELPMEPVDDGVVGDDGITLGEAKKKDVDEPTTPIDEKELVCASEFFQDIVKGGSTPAPAQTKADDAANPLLGDDFIKKAEPEAAADDEANPLLGDDFVKKTKPEDTPDTMDEADFFAPVNNAGKMNEREDNSFLDRVWGGDEGRNSSDEFADDPDNDEIVDAAIKGDDDEEDDDPSMPKLHEECHAVVSPEDVFNLAMSEREQDAPEPTTPAEPVAPTTEPVAAPTDDESLAESLNEFRAKNYRLFS